MRGTGLTWFLVMAAIAAYCQVEPVFAQQQTEEGKCRVDEVDVGDYCAGLPPAITQSETDRRRVTWFRGVGMMPGKVEARNSQAPPSPDPAPPADSVIGGGYGVQLGAYSSKRIATSVALSATSPGNPVLLARLERGDQILWACIQGPYPDKQSAQAARERIRGDKRFRSAWVKPVDDLDLMEPVNDTTEQ